MEIKCVYSTRTLHPNGEENIIICPNKEYVEEGYIAIDNYDGDITDKVEIKKDKSMFLLFPFIQETSFWNKY